MTLLKGRVSITPMTHSRHRWILRGEGSLHGLFAKVILPLGMASPTGTDASECLRIEGVSDLKVA